MKIGYNPYVTTKERLEAIAGLNSGNEMGESSRVQQNLLIMATSSSVSETIGNLSCVTDTIHPSDKVPKEVIDAIM